MIADRPRPRNRSGLSARLALAVGLVASPLAAQAPEPVDTAAVRLIRQEAFERSHVLRLASVLTDVYGPRLTGSPGERAAAVWAQQMLADWGLADARLEDWGTLGHGWTNHAAVARVIAPQPFPVYLNVPPWTRGTGGPVRGNVVLEAQLGLETRADLKRLRGTLRGRFVLSERIRFSELSPFRPLARRWSDAQLDSLATLPAHAPPPAAPGGAPSGLAATAAPPAAPPLTPAERMNFLIEEGVHAILTATAGGGGTMFSGGLRGSPTDIDRPALPTAGLAVEHFGRIRRLLEIGIPVELELHIENRFHDPRPSANVIAEIPGTDPARRDEIVMIGAHLDSEPYATGATDNAAGVAVMMEVVRILTVLDLPLRRTVRIALWTGEEQGLLGSTAYVERHFRPADCSRCEPGNERVSVYFNHDNGTGAIRGVWLEGNDAALPIFRAWFEPFADFGRTALTARGIAGTDHLPFNAVGIPGFQFIQDPIDYGTRTHHSNMDYYERLQEEDLKRNAAIIAAFVYHAANRAERFPRVPTPEPAP